MISKIKKLVNLKNLNEGQALAHEVIDYLLRHGFKLSGVYNMTYDKKGIAIQGDFLFSIAMAGESQSP